MRDMHVKLSVTEQERDRLAEAVSNAQREIKELHSVRTRVQQVWPACCAQAGTHAAAVAIQTSWALAATRRPSSKTSAPSWTSR